ncbi:hypothetical protein TWF281_010294 [Arthrobotrys megalospora]
MQFILFALFALSSRIFALPQATYTFKNLDRVAAAKAKAEFDAKKALPFKIVDWKDLPSKDHKQSWAYRNNVSARTLPDGTIEEPVKLVERNVGGVRPQNSL